MTEERKDGKREFNNGKGIKKERVQRIPTQKRMNLFHLRKQVMVFQKKRQLCKLKKEQNCFPKIELFYDGSALNVTNCVAAQ